MDNKEEIKELARQLLGESLPVKAKQPKQKKKRDGMTVIFKGPVGENVIVESGAVHCSHIDISTPDK